MTGKSPTIMLNNGVAVPALGLGVYQASAEDTVRAVIAAIDQRYRLIDTAKAYANGSQVGQGIRASRVDRAGLFGATKLRLTDCGSDASPRGFEGSMEKLGLEVLDLYLLHRAARGLDATVQSYKALEKLLTDGRVRTIGVGDG